MRIWAARAPGLKTVNDVTEIRRRHPEKAHKPDNPIQQKPARIRAKVPTSATYHQTLKIIRENNLRTVGEEAVCPNNGECRSKKHATMMFMGAVCTRASWSQPCL